MVRKNAIYPCCDGTALDTARFYAETFPDSAVGPVYRAPIDYPAGQHGDGLTVEFSVIGIPCVGLNSGPAIKHSEAFSFQVATDDQAETDRVWHAIIGKGGQASECGWCKDKWGLSWQITPRALKGASADPDRAPAQPALQAMMQMTKIDSATIEAARLGWRLPGRTRALGLHDSKQAASICPWAMRVRPPRTRPGVAWPVSRGTAVRRHTPLQRYCSASRIAIVTGGAQASQLRTLCLQ